MSEFYIGYLPKAPVGIGRHMRRTGLVLGAVAVAAAAVFAGVQRTFLPASFEFGSQRTFTGVIEARPYPSLLVTRPGARESEAGTSRYLLVGKGKHGYTQEAMGWQGKLVRLQGTLIYRDGETMLEVASGPVALPPGPEPRLPGTEDLGEFALTGEIVDGKCNLGVMNPGAGKVHLDCAVRCLAGGVPAGFATDEFRGRPGLLWLTGPGGTAFETRRYASVVARPVRIRGRVKRSGDTLFLEVPPEGAPQPLD